MSVDDLRRSVDAERLKSRRKIRNQNAVKPILVQRSGRRQGVNGTVIACRFPFHREFSHNALILAENNNGNILLSCCPGPKGHATSVQFCALRDKSMFHRFWFLWFELGPLSAIFRSWSSMKLPGQNALLLRKASTGTDFCRLILLR